MRRFSLILVAFAFGLSACGGHSSNAKNASEAKSSDTSNTNPFSAYQQCMKDHGVTVPDRDGNRRPNQQNGGAPPDGAGGPPPGGGGDGGQRNQPPAGVSQQTFDTARTACADKRPQRPGGGVRGAASPAYLGCLKDNGVAVDPSAGATALNNVDRNSDAYKAARTKCAALLPQRPSGSTTTTIAAG